MRVRELMQAHVRTVDAGTSLDVVERLMREEVIRHLPIVERGQLVGMITHRDLLRAGLSPSRSVASVIEQGFAEVPVRDVMTRQVLHAHPDADLADAVTLMVRERVGCLPVVDGEGRLVGILTETDCMRCLSSLLQSERTVEAPARRTGTISSG